MRVLGRLRLSRSTEESTSIERQREIIQQWANASGHNIIGWAEDIDVSGSVDPFETPQLGEWLNLRAPEWDIVCAWKLNRLGRNAIQLSKLFGWCMDHGKTVVSCSESIDLGTWAGRMLASVIAGLAEGELEAIRERQRSSRQKLRDSARWAGGKPPFGYQKVPHYDGKGWALAIDPLSSSVVRRIVDDFLDGRGLTRIAKELTDEGYRTPAEYHLSVKSGTPEVFGGKSKWHITPLRNMLTSRSLRGYVHHNGTVVRGEDGLPLQFAEPLVTSDEWQLIQGAIDSVSRKYQTDRRPELSPLAGLVSCIVCGETLHHSRNTVKGKEYRYYRCPSRDTVMIPADDLEDIAGETFLHHLGDYAMQERVWVSGDSHEVELREAVTALDELTAAAGRAVSATAKQRLQRQISALDGRIAELESMPVREARWEYRSTGGTYRDAWERTDETGKRELLVKSGITLVAGITGVEGKRSQTNAGALRLDIRIPDDLTDNMG